MWNGSAAAGAQSQNKYGGNQNMIDTLKKRIRLRKPSLERGSWQRNLAVLWVGELIAIAGFSVTLPFLPYYIQELGITRVDQVAFWTGLVTASQAVTMALVAPVWGSLADRYGRKIMVVRAMFGGAVIISAMGFVANIYQLVILRAIQGTLTGTVPAATTLVAGSTPDNRRGYALGLLQMAIYLGSSIGPLIGGMVADTLGMRAAFWVTGGLLFTAGVLVSIFVREEFTPKEESHDADSPTSKPRLWDGLLIVLGTRALLVVFGIRVLMRTAFRIVSPVMPLFVQQLAEPDAKVASLTGTITGLSSATSALSAIVLGRLSDRTGPRRILLVSGGIACVLYALQSTVSTTTQFLILRVLTGAVMGGIVAATSALLAQLAPKDRFGAVYGINTSLTAAANAIAPMLGAALTASWGLSSAFLGAAAIYGLATGVIALLVPRSRPHTEPEQEPVEA
jgi:DHA1 family multidrug resistance protein-like MFS transporter